MQRQRCAYVAVGQHQHGEAANGDLGVFSGCDVIRPQLRAVVIVGRGIERDGIHRLLIQRVEKGHAVQPHTPMRVRRWRGVH